MDVMVIKEGTIVTPYSMYQADVKVVDGVITAIAKDIESEGTVIDAKGKLVLPGAVDVHTHLELPFNGTTSADDYYDGSDSSEDRASFCPLRELPERSDHPEHCDNGRFDAGWNACLDTIEGGVHEQEQSE